jgi:hypothetical protein
MPEGRDVGAVTLASDVLAERQLEGVLAHRDIQTNVKLWERVFED